MIPPIIAAKIKMPKVTVDTGGKIPISTVAAIKIGMELVNVLTTAFECKPIKS
ncbi:hypothetical protein D3C79_1118650 [compost metagenome]